MSLDLSIDIEINVNLYDTDSQLLIESLIVLAFSNDKNIKACKLILHFILMCFRKSWALRVLDLSIDIEIIS